MSISKHMEKIKLKETVIVEGKYDHIRLSSIFDANILELGGFNIYNNKQRLALIRRMAEKNGVIILTDSDSAGFRIRHYLMSALPVENVKNVYIPAIHGKERRKLRPGKENLLGVEGMSTEFVLKAFAAAGITAESAPAAESLSTAYLYSVGLSGGANSSALRRQICEHFDLPPLLSSSALCRILPAITDKAELEAVIAKLRSADTMSNS